MNAPQTSYLVWPFNPHRDKTYRALVKAAPLSDLAKRLWDHRVERLGPRLDFCWEAPRSSARDLGRKDIKAIRRASNELVKAGMLIVFARYSQCRSKAQLQSNAYSFARGMFAGEVGAGATPIHLLDYAPAKAIEISKHLAQSGNRCLDCGRPWHGWLTLSAPVSDPFTFMPCRSGQKSGELAASFYGRKGQLLATLRKFARDRRLRDSVRELIRSGRKPVTYRQMVDALVAIDYPFGVTAPEDRVSELLSNWNEVARRRIGRRTLYSAADLLAGDRAGDRAGDLLSIEYGHP